MEMAKESLMDSIDIQDVIARGPKDWIEELRVELYETAYASTSGAQGLGGLSRFLCFICVNSIFDQMRSTASKLVVITTEDRINLEEDVGSLANAIAAHTSRVICHVPAGARVAQPRGCVVRYGCCLDSAPDR